jgi:hypothetical protein
MTNGLLIYGMVELFSVRLTIARVPLGWDKRSTTVIHGIVELCSV